MNASTLHRTSLRVLITAVVAAIALVMVNGSAAAQRLDPCPQFPVIISANPAYGTAPFPLAVGFNYASMSGAPQTFTGSGSYTIPSIPGQGVPISVYINLPNGTHITIPNGTQSVVIPYTDPATGITFKYIIWIKYDANGCPSIEIIIDITTGGIG